MRQDLNNAPSADDCDKCRVPVSDGTSIVRHLRLAGHEVTPARAAVIQAVAAQPRPFTASELCAAVAERAPSVGRATVFRTLDLLEQARVVDRLHSLQLERALAAAARQHAFRGAGSQVEIFGRCQSC